MKSSTADDTLTRAEWRNIIWYISGIMAFKFAYETLGSAIGIIVQEHFDKSVAVTFLAVLTAMFNLMQCLFSIGTAMLIKRWTSKSLLSISIWCFGGVVAVLIVIEASTGGTLQHGGQWSPYLLFPLYMLMGGCLGTIELIRRVIPRDIVGEHPEKLKKMDATVHIWYEVSGTAGAFFSAYLINVLRPVYALVIMPVFFVLAGVLWTRLDKRTMTGLIEDERRHSRDSVAEVATQVEPPSLWTQLSTFFRTYLLSIRLGAQIIFSSRRFGWLIAGYTLPLVLHRFIENVIFPTFARTVLKNGALSGILLGGSNFGELCGAALVLIVGSRIMTPLPWVRIDAMALSVLWVFPFAGNWISDSFTPLKVALSLMPLMILLSSGWAAGDVSLAAYIQNQLSFSHHPHADKVSPLGAVMAFLYSSYILIFTVISPIMGRVFDMYNVNGNIEVAFFWVCGVGIAVFCAIIIFGSTYIPPGSWAWNPKRIGSSTEGDGSEPENVEMGGIQQVDSDDDVMAVVFG